MREAAAKMVMSYRANVYGRYSATPEAADSYQAAMQDFRQAAFDANPEYNAYCTEAIGERTGLPLLALRFSVLQQNEARKAFDTALQEIVKETIGTLKIAGQLPENFFIKDEGRYYANGLPPLGETNAAASRFA